METNRNAEKRIMHIASGYLPVVLLFLVALLVIPTYAWLAMQRSVIAVAEIDAPTNIKITAANNEAIQYLDFSGVDMRQGGHHKYFAFTVSGEDIELFMLQLAYTTNNQFTFTLYPGTEVNNPQSALVEYRSHEAGNAVHYYNISGSAIELTYLNAVYQNGVTIGAINDSLYSQTYEDTTSNHVDKYAVPIYCQSEEVESQFEDAIHFCNTFILEVSWGERINDKETDIIYIAAKGV